MTEKQSSTPGLPSPTEFCFCCSPARRAHPSHPSGLPSILLISRKQESRSLGYSSNRNTNSGGRETQISASSQDLGIVSVTRSVLMREISRDQITKTPSLPSTCLIKGKGENHMSVCLQCHPYGKGGFGLWEDMREGTFSMPPSTEHASHQHHQSRKSI